MSHRLEDIDARLTRLRDATGRVVPAGDFTARVSAALAREGAVSDWVRDLILPARWLVPVAAVVAAVGVLWATQSARAGGEDPVAKAATELDTEW